MWSSIVTVRLIAHTTKSDDVQTVCAVFTQERGRS